MCYIRNYEIYRKEYLQEFGSDNDDGSGSITDFSILELGELNNDLCGRVLDFELLEDGGT